MTTVAAGAFGAIVGSYLNVVIYRLPREETREWGSRSICPSCGARVPAWLNLPIVSWLILRGRTRCCGKPLSLRYPFVEALTAALFVALHRAPPSGRELSLADIDGEAAFAFLLHAFFVANLVANTFIDIDFRILPDALTKPLMVVGVLGAFFLPGVFGGFEALARMPAGANAALYSGFGLLTGVGLTWGVRVLARAAFGKEAMGLGDVKLMGGVGAFLGWSGALTTFFLGCLLGAVGGTLSRLLTRDPYVAFGPYLVAGALGTLFFEASLITFLTVTWPEWQRQHADSPWVLVVTGLLAVVLLVILVRRGRSL